VTVVRIGLVVYGSLATRSGGYLYDRKLVAALQQQGSEVVLLSLPWRNYGRHLLDNVDDRLLRRAQAAQLDLLLQDELNHPSLVLQNRWLRHKLNIPLISIVHHLRSRESHPWLARVLYAGTELFYVNTVDGFIYNSETTRRSVEALLRHSQPATVAYPAADHVNPPDRATVSALIDQRATHPGPLHVVAVGNVAPRKNLHTVLHSLARLPQSLWRFTIAGALDVDSTYVSRLRLLAADLGIAPNVHFAGALDDSALHQLYAAGHVLALPSFEGFGIVYLEAMAFGMVPIASQQGAAHEIIDDGHNGYLVGSDDVAALTACLDTLQRNRPQWQALAHAARRRYDSHPTWQESMAQAARWLGDFQR
jgi:glycosyltransferase involved in cell wall biosynthesis